MLTIYKASAGSGKTFTLALEYTKLLLGVKDPGKSKYRLNSAKYAPDNRYLANRHRGILAITFTNKATDEMKTRIINEIDALRRMPGVDGKDSPYVPILLGEFGCTRQELAKTADDALTQLLNDYQHFNVSTIDSFFQTVLRTFAREVDRQGDYDIELNDKAAISTGIGMMLDDLNYGDKDHVSNIEGWMRDYMDRKISDNTKFNAFNRDSTVLSSLSGYVNAISNEKFKTQAAATLDYIKRDVGLRTFRGKLTEYIKAQQPAAIKAATDILEELRGCGFPNEALNKTILGFLNSVIAGEPLSDKPFGTKAVMGAMDPDSLESFKKLYLLGNCPGSGKNKQIPPDEFTYHLADAVKTIYNATFGILAYTKILEACDGLEFISFAWEYIDKFRKENNLILLSDTNDLIRRIINGSEMPFIYERLGVTLTNFLIDEFQDTSHLQWDNLKPLVANSIAEDNDSLIIGDEKQAIYRFRNSDSSLLHYKVANEDFKEHQRIVKGDAPGENSNYRSAPDIVRFNNTIFRNIAQAESVDTYDNVAQSIPDKNNDKTAYITIQDASNLAEVNGYSGVFEATAQAIRRQHDAGYRWRDIVVLVRRREEASAILNYLMEFHRDIQLASDEALLLMNSKAVRLIVSLLKLLDVSYNEDNAATKANDAGQTKYGTMQDTLMMISRYNYHMGNLHSVNSDDGSSVEDALLSALNPDDKTSEDIHREVNEIRSQNSSNLISLVETIIKLRIPDDQRKSEFTYISAFQDLVIDYCSRFNPSIHAFTEWWEDNKEKLAVTASAESDAVTVMTVHKAKGLEWDCVHIPFASWKLYKDDASIWVNVENIPFIRDDEHPPMLYVTQSKALRSDASPFREQLLEDIREQTIDNLNCAYVALTRPCRELSIYYDSSTKDKENSFGALLTEALSKPDLQYGDDEQNALYMPFADYYNDGTFVFGEPTTPDQKQLEKEAARKSKALEESLRRPIPPYVVIHRDDTTNLTSVEDAISLDATLDIGNDEVKSPVDEKEQDEERAKRGLWLHYVLADMRDYKDLDKAISSKRARTPIDDETLADYSKVLHKAFDDVPTYRDRWFVNHKRALTECSIYEIKKNKVLRPDRIVFTEDGNIEIVDYKFTHRIKDEHKEQVAEYIKELTDMGYEGVKGYLWYPEKGKVLPVDPAAADNLFSE
jgi:ATP-dependent exoDNAse (exonuclease V) beta subunit